MSSAVILMNNAGVAIAADSAITYGNRSSILNSSEKIFQIDESVAIVTVGSAIINNSSIDTMIKRFADHVKERDIDYDHLEDYQKNFIKFIEDNESKFFLSKNESFYLEDKIDHLLEKFKEFKEELFKEVPYPKLSLDQMLEIVKKFDEYFETRLIRSTSLEKYTEKNYFDLLMKEMDYYEIELGNDVVGYLLVKVIEGAHDMRINASTLTFVGYGTKDEFPATSKIDIYGFFKGKLKYKPFDVDSISDEVSKSINILAQRDAIDAYLDGVTHSVEDSIFDFLKEEIAEHMMDDYFSDEERELVHEIILDIDEERYNLAVDATRNRWSGVYNAVGGMSESDLAHLAYSLIEIISLKRRYSLDDSLARTVGGPTDVAIITKSKQFEWVKVKNINSFNI
jgi:hypothetical protein